MIALAGVAATAAFGAGTVAAAGKATDPAPTFQPVGTYATGLGAGSSETVAYDRKRLYVTNSANNSLDIVDASDAAHPGLVKRIDLSPWGAGPNSVDVTDGLVAVAVEAAPKTSPGTVVFFRTTGEYVAHVAVGALPDMLAFAGDGKTLAVANEGEPSSYGQPASVDPEGSVSLIDTKDHRKATWAPTATTVSFAPFNGGAPRAAEVPAGVRLNGPGASVAQDLEPEYITFSKDDRTAYVTLQEANTVAVVDVRAARVTKLAPLGAKDPSLPGNGLDASDRDGKVNIRTWPIKGLYMPDAIARFTVKGRSYLVTANEGDARDWPGFGDEARVSSLTLATPELNALKGAADLGRLNVSRTDGKDASGAYTQLFAFGARSASIWDAENGTQVWDSGDLFERVVAATPSAIFNASNDDNTFDSRSDNKGPEPEGVAIGTIGRRTLAFVGLERIGGFMVLDVSDPEAPQFLQWANNRVFAGTSIGPDSGPEILRFIDAKDSPGGQPTVIVANEISGTVTLYEAAPTA
jgi:sugar lactone lactonase YvrE